MKKKTVNEQTRLKNSLQLFESSWLQEMSESIEYSLEEKVCNTILCTYSISHTHNLVAYDLFLSLSPSQMIFFLVQICAGKV